MHARSEREAATTESSFLGCATGGKVCARSLTGRARLSHTVPRYALHPEALATTCRARSDHADQLRGSRAKVAMMILAMEYEMLAVRAEQRELAQKPARHRRS